MPATRPPRKFVHDALLSATLNPKLGLQLPAQDASISEDDRFHSGEVVEGACSILEMRNQAGYGGLLGISGLRTKTNETETMRERVVYGHTHG